MTAVKTLAQTFSDYGASAIVAVLIFVIVKLYKDVMSLNKEIRTVAQEGAKRDAQIVETLNRNTEALKQNAATTLEMKIAIQGVRSLIERRE